MVLEGVSILGLGIDHLKILQEEKNFLWVFLSMRGFGLG